MTLALTIYAIFLPFVAVLTTCNQCFWCFDVSCGGFLIRLIGLIAFIVVGVCIVLFGI